MTCARFVVFYMAVIMSRVYWANPITLRWFCLESTAKTAMRFREIKMLFSALLKPSVDWQELI